MWSAVGSIAVLMASTSVLVSAGPDPQDAAPASPESTDGPQLIINGRQTVNPGWVARVLVGIPASNQFARFTGTLIDKDWVLTSAHSFAPIYDMTTDPPTLLAYNCGPDQLDPITGECTAPGLFNDMKRGYTEIGATVRVEVTDAPWAAPDYDIRTFGQVFINPKFYTVTNTSGATPCSSIHYVSPNLTLCLENPYDVALIRLNQTSAFPTLQYSCDPKVPCPSLDPGNPFVITWGWGLCRSNFDECTPGQPVGVSPPEAYPYFLQATGPLGQPVRDPADCGGAAFMNNTYNACVYGENFNLGWAGAYNGDSGGPVVALVGQQNLLVATTAYGFNLDDPTSQVQLTPINYPLRTGGATCDFIKKITGRGPSKIVIPSCATPTCGTLPPMNAYTDTSACRTLFPGQQCPVSCRAGSASGPSTTLYTCTDTPAGPVYTGSPPQCLAPTCTVSTPNDRNTDLSACAGVRYGTSCQIQCKAGYVPARIPALMTARCPSTLGSSSVVVAGQLCIAAQKCYSTRAGVLLPGQRKFVPYNNRLDRFTCSTVRNRPCKGYWAVCNGSTGKIVPQCVY